MKKSRLIILVLSVFLILSGAALYMLLWTTIGVKTLVGVVLNRQVTSDHIDLDVQAGNLMEGVTFQNLEFRNLIDLPIGSVLKVQQAYVAMTSLTVDGLVVRVENARLLIPNADAIVVEGSLENEELDVNVFANTLSLETVLNYFPEAKAIQKKLKGYVRDVDLQMTGVYDAPSIQGQITVGEVSYDGIIAKDIDAVIAVDIKSLEGDGKVDGHIDLKNGRIQSKRTLVNLAESNISFSGDPKNPYFHINGNSTIEKTKIDIVFKGTLDKPDIVVTSEPSYPREKLLIMLATGKSWKGLDSSLEQGTVSPNLVGDFVDYFVFGGRGNAIADKFGITDVSVTMEKNKSGVSATKSLGDKLDIGYGVVQTIDEDKSKEVTQTIGGKVKVTDAVSIGVEREITQKQSDTSREEEAVVPNDKVFLKFEKDF